VHTRVTLVGIQAGLVQRSVAVLLRQAAE